MGGHSEDGNQGIGQDLLDYAQGTAKETFGRIDPESLSEAGRVVVSTGQRGVKIFDAGNTYIAGREIIARPGSQIPLEAQRIQYEADKAAGIPLNYDQYPAFDPNYTPPSQEQWNEWIDRHNKKVLANEHPLG